jgi:hypothetical protein
VNKDRILDDIDNWAFDKMRELAKDLMMRYLIVERHSRVVGYAGVGRHAACMRQHNARASGRIDD